METRVTGLLQFQECPRKWYLGYHLKAKRDIFRPEMFIGTLVHKGLQSYFINNKKIDWDEWNNQVENELDKLELEFGATYLNIPDIPDHIELARGILAHYELTASGNYKIIAVEKELSVKYRGHILNGTIDLVIEDTNGEIWIVDHKVTGHMFEMDGIEYDDQTTAYCWMWWKTYKYIPSGGMFNLILRDVPEVKYLINGNPSLDKNQHTTVEYYKGKLTSSQLEDPKYQEFLQYLELNGKLKFFRQYCTRRTKNELLQFEKRLSYWMKQLRLESKVSLDKTIVSLNARRCPFCTFKSICRMVTLGEDWQWMLETMVQKEPETLDIFN